MKDKVLKPIKPNFLPVVSGASEGVSLQMLTRGGELLVPAAQRGLGYEAEQHTATTPRIKKGSTRSHTHIQESVILCRKRRT